MGFFDRFKKSAAPQPPAKVTAVSQPGVVAATATGTVIALADVADPVFSGGIMGPGCGIEPSEGVVYAPVSGTISATTHTWHAVGLTSDDGIEVLVHVGIDTVEMKGDGFVGFVEDGQHVEAGQPLLTFDRDKVAAAGYSDVVITVITNADAYEQVKVVEPGAVSAGSQLIELS